ncbi:endonuclease/exonuclease/phosphatase family protein [Arthrobacter mobilis]|uniref:endonuclease/exonuclease/phosphatase family protein n=1 Tax=Arthrobacter mobilis TaxID=2724944 RepID=UPI0028A8D493|nr:endonuclease/exonuclease/phosphatase family protein [Arthrobacter mobilis]
MAVLVVLMLAAGAALPAPGPPGGGRIELRVMSFNIHYGNDLDGELDLEHIAEDIEDSGAQIIGLQEVDRRRSARSAFVDQAAWLARRLGMYYSFGLNRTYWAPGREKPGRFGLVVLSKYPILSTRNHMLTLIDYARRPTKPRSILETVIDVDGTWITFYNTHLDHQRSEQRQLQAREILALAGKSAGPAILVGDLNAEYPDPEIARLRSVFTDTFVVEDMAEDYTYPADDPYSRIDYIMTRGPILVHEAEVIDDSDSSDHLPITADLSIERDPAWQSCAVRPPDPLPARQRCEITSAGR